MFVDTVQSLLSAGANIADAEQNTGIRNWMLANTALWRGDPLDIADMAEAFARAGLAEQYATAINDAQGSRGDAMSAKMQSDYLAAQERAFRLRHATPIRCALHAAGRRNAHGLASVGPIARVQGLAQDLLVAGGAGFETRDPPAAP